MARQGDVVVDYDDIARALGSPALWRHPEPWRTQAEHELQARLTHAYRTQGTGTVWLLRTAPRPTQRQTLATRWQATVYLLDPGEAECRRRAKRDQRPPGTSRAVSDWYHWHRPRVGDRDPGELDPRWTNPAVRALQVDPKSI